MMDAIPILNDRAAPRLLVTAHPDDETLWFGGMMLQSPAESQKAINQKDFNDYYIKVVGKKDRRDLRYCHLAFAIRTDFHRGYYGTCQLRTHDISFRPTKCWGGEKAHP